MAILSHLIDPKELVNVSPQGIEQLNALVHLKLFSNQRILELAPEVTDLYNRIKSKSGATTKAGSTRKKR